MSAKTKPWPKTSKPLPVWKKAVFAVVACGVVLVAIEGGLAVFGVKPIRYESDPYVGFSARLPLFVREGEKMMTAENKRRIFNYQEFPVRKAENAYRIFCMGGSTTYGHPYTDSTSFCGWLRAMLPKADQSRRWEVINCGGVSYASYREALLMEELSKYEPDLFIVLSGHNEFLEQRTYGEIIRMPEVVRGANAVLSKTRAYGVLKRGVEKARGGGSAGTPRPTTGSNVLSEEVEAILDHTVGPQAYHRDEGLRKSVIDHFRFNVARMVDIARSAGAEVILVSPAVNLRNCSPFKSEHRAGITPPEAAEWQRLVRHATQQHRTTNWAEAVSALERAVQIDGRFADGYYLLGHALWELKNFDEARAAFVRALDEDVCPLRALPEMVVGMREVAAQRQVALVDFVKLMESKSPHGAPGDDWFLDHVHPTIEGHRVLGLALMEKMSERGWLRVSSNWNAAAQQEVKRAVESTLTPKEHGVALCTLAKVIAWAGKGADAHRIALRARALAPGEAAVHFEVGKNASHIGKKDEAIAALKEALKLQPDFAEAKCLMGMVLMDTGQTDEALRFSREAVDLRPEDARLRVIYGGLLSRGERLEEAAAACREALKHAPNYAEAHNTLASVLKRQGKFSEALPHFREAVRLRPGSPSAMIGLAWVLATHPDARVRNAGEAVEIGERLAELSRYQNWMALDTLAAAYAAAGRFPEAVQTQRKTLELVRGGSPADVAAVQARLARYEQRQPYIEGTGSD